MDREPGRPTFLQIRRVAGWVRLALVALAPLALGSVHPWVVATESLLAVGVLAATLLPGHRSSRWDRPYTVPWPVIALFGATILTLLQIIPLPPAVLAWISPEGEMLGRSAAQLAGVEPGWRPLSLDASATSLQALRVLGLFSLAFAQVVVTRREGIQAVRKLLWALAIAGGASVALGGMRELIGSRALLGFYVPVEALPADTAFKATFVNPNHQGAFLGLAALAALTVALRSSDRLGRVAGWLLAAACMAATILTRSRGSAVAAGLGLIALVWILAASGRRKGTPALPIVAGAVAVLLAVVTAATLIGWVSLTDEWRTTFEGGIGEAAWSKWGVVESSGSLISDYPAFGVGRGAFEATFSRYNDVAPHLSFPYLENEPVQAIAEWGAVGGGLILALLTFGTVFHAVRRFRDPLLAGPTVILTALAIHNLVDFNLSFNGLALPAAALLGCLTSGVGEKEGHTRVSRLVGTPIRRRTILVSVAFLIALGGFLAAGPYGASLRDDVSALRARAAGATLEKDEVRAAILRHPASFLLPLVAGESFLHRGDVSAAMPWVDAAAFRAPWDLRARDVRVRALLMAGRFDEARQVVSGIREYRRRWPIETYEALFAEPRCRNRIVFLAPAPDADRRVTLEVADYYEKKDRPDLVERTLGRALAAQPDDPVFAARLGRLLLGRNRTAEASALATRVMAAHPEVPEGYELLGKTLLMKGEALQAYHLFLEAADHGGQESLFAAAEAAISARLPENGLLDRLSGTCGGPDRCWRVAVLRSRFAEAEGRLTQAITAMEEADRLKPGLAENLRRLASLEEKVGDLAGAIFTLRKILDRNPDDGSARTELQRLQRYGIGPSRKPRSY
jgi:tetratricopeptide (TPR) repeat protein